MNREIKFLLKTNENDRDCVKYIEFEEDGTFHICGACFYNMQKKDQDEILANYEEITTALTKEGLQRLFEIDQKFYTNRTEEDSVFIDYVKKAVYSDLNEKLWAKVQEEEKDYLYEEYNLDYNDIEDIFDNYYLPYRDRGIICTVYGDADELGQYIIDEGLMGNVSDRLTWYIDTEKLGEDTASDSDNYLTLDDGRIVEFNN